MSDETIEVGDTVQLTPEALYEIGDDPRRLGCSDEPYVTAITGRDGKLCSGKVVQALSSGSVVVQWETGHAFTEKPKNLRKS